MVGQLRIQYELMPVQISSLKKDPEFERQFTRDENTIKMLKESIQHEGLIQPIIVDRNFVVIDGHSRLKAIEELAKEGKDVKYVTVLRLPIDISTDEGRTVAMLIAKVVNVVRRPLTVAEILDAMEVIEQLRKSMDTEKIRLANEMEEKLFEGMHLTDPQVETLTYIATKIKQNYPALYSAIKKTGNKLDKDTLMRLTSANPKVLREMSEDDAIELLSIDGLANVLKDPEIREMLSKARTPREFIETIVNGRRNRNRKKKEKRSDTEDVDTTHVSNYESRASENNVNETKPSETETSGSQQQETVQEKAYISPRRVMDIRDLIDYIELRAFIDDIERQAERGEVEINAHLFNAIRRIIEIERPDLVSKFRVT